MKSVKLLLTSLPDSSSKHWPETFHSNLLTNRLSEFTCKSVMKKSRGQDSCQDCDLGWLIT